MGLHGEVSSVLSPHTVANRTGNQGAFISPALVLLGQGQTQTSGLILPKWCPLPGHLQRQEFPTAGAGLLAPRARRRGCQGPGGLEHSLGIWPCLCGS